MKDETPIHGGQRATRSESKGPKKKSRRVSQRRELAVVTLGAVATITGLGGLLAANPPSWATDTQAAAPAESVLVDQADPPPRNDERGRRGPDVASVQADVEPAPTREDTPQAPVEQAQPVYSAPSPASAATRSRGS